MEYVWTIVCIAAIWGYVKYQGYKEAQAIRARNKGEVLRIAEQAQRLFEKIAALKTNTAKTNNASKALSLLRKADEYPECREVIQNYDELTERLNALVKALPVITHIEKAYKNKFKGKDAAEKNALLDALYQIKTTSVTNDDFEKSRAYPEGTGEIVRIENIENRLRQLGWEE